jgi:hypothetical protein
MGAAFVGRKYFVWADARKPAKNKTERREIEEARNLQRSRQDLIFPQLGRVTFRYFQHGNHILCWEDEVGDREPITSYSYCIHSLHFLAQILRRTGW